MKTFCILSAFALVGTCATTKYTTKIQNLKDSIYIVDSTLVVNYAHSITAEELSKTLHAFASNNFEGRKTGEEGQKLAAQFLTDYYIKEKIASPFRDSMYFQNIPETFFSNNIKASENVLAYIEGSEKPNELIIISAHLDHLGVDDSGDIYFGADDNGSGTSAVMEIAQAFQQAKNDGHGPKRSILFLHLTAEEIGTQGSLYYTQNPVFPLENTIANLNIDMIGRIDNIHKEDKNYIYLIGSDRLSKELHYLSEKVNNTYFNINLDYRFNAENDENRYYFRSDHYNFAAHGIPVIFYFNGEHADYHKTTDTPDKIDYQLLQNRTRLIFATAWQLANQPNKLVVDTKNQLLLN
ncbi:M28 family peptidase [Confluentibacter citreus]|uniref:M28 family peptidase n=1 Tax=Confluentibacter citreus TaxID=2007307 RepID=UPI000C288627|nr:M28 family peptidase [Confluentibacter citreus]